MAQPIDHVAMQAMRRPEGLAVVELATMRRWSYAAFDDAVARCATVLRHGHGCAPGDRVGALAKNCFEIVALHLACVRIGAIFVPFNWRLSPAELAVLVADADLGIMFGDAELARAGIEGIGLDVLAEAIATASCLPHAPFDPDMPSLLLYTSGTSGRPKGVPITARGAEQTAIHFGLLGGVNTQSIFLIDSPLFHVLGIVGNVAPPLMFGGTILISEGFDAARTLSRIIDPALGVTHYFGVPQMAQLLRAQPDFNPAKLNRLVGIFTGGAPNPAEDIRAWLDDGVMMVNGFGMSEASGSVFTMPHDPAITVRKAGSVGFGIPEMRSRIVDGNDADCPDGTPGELLLRGANIVNSYWRRPEETAKAFTADGWFRTGDIAMRDEDGYYYIVDRKKDMFISGGENVYPAEIEAAMADFPGLREVAVVGVPDRQWGEVGHLALVAAPEAKIEAGAVLEHLGARIARFKIPKHVSIMEALPRTGSGKIQKPELRTMLQTLAEA